MFARRSESTHKAPCVAPRIVLFGVVNIPNPVRDVKYYSKSSFNQINRIAQRMRVFL